MIVVIVTHNSLTATANLVMRIKINRIDTVEVLKSAEGVGVRELYTKERSSFATGAS